MTAPVIEEPLAIARERLFQKLQREEGTKCPCCEQWAQCYRRVLGSTIAVPLVKIHRRATRDRDSVKPGAITSETALAQGYVDVREFRFRGGDYAKGQFFGLLEAHPTSENLFRLTPLGIDFVEGRVNVPRHALIYNNTAVGFGKKLVHIKTALGTHFDLDTLMRGEV